MQVSVYCDVTLQTDAIRLPMTDETLAASGALFASAARVADDA